MVQIQKVPVVTIITRHSADCPFLGDEQYKKCGCWKHLRYRENGKPKWKATGQTTWAGAERYKMNFLNSLDPALAPTLTQEGITLRAAIAEFLQNKKGENISAGVISAYKRELNQLVDYMERTGGVYLLNRVTTPHLNGFRQTLVSSLADSTRHEIQVRQKVFFKYATDVYGLARNPTQSLTPISVEQKITQPFTPAEYDDMVALVTTTTRLRRDTLTRLHALIELMRHSGLAIRDAVCLPRTGLQRDENGYRIVTRRRKTRKKTNTIVSVPIPLHVALRLQTLHSGHADYFFWNGVSTPDNATGRYHDAFHRLFPDVHPHMLRDTFAVEWLKAGLSLFELSKLLGHSTPNTTAKHYAPWVKGLQDKMESSMRAHWEASAVSA